ncbi:phenylalanine--tRNA ligase subunit beta [Microlunatus panaciterrae]|uniref:Phenylalanine--tRNA ligase beta subunit n=1 Tax=Microlunatus panaciterrae TaxID=400768 RepID=A0ABS2RN75_9ACTN|nr:phenylalanine--tRNA ligase subunit beta [Microlunatus panaciterrae]MBM7800445.1 phenylalanyl-tRNA synthetase beta chain [Microlunatus panaciterrae]
MRAPLSWLREHAALPEELGGRHLAEALIRAGLEVETVEQAGADVTGPLVVGRVLSYENEKHSNGKVIRYCRLDVGEHNDPADGDQPPSRGIVCGAHNFQVGDLVVVALPGAVLPGEFAIAARRTYGHVSDGMICSARELGLGDDHSGIMVLPDDGLVPGQDAAPVLHLRDEVLDIAVTPDRGYCLSIRGLARESAQATRTTFTDPVDRPVPAESTAGWAVSLESPAAPLFVAVTVRGVDPSRPSPRWLARRVQLAGMRPISLAVDITNYVMLQTGQPLHAYDADRLNGGIVVREARAGEKLTTLDDIVRDLDPADLVIADDRGPIGLAGVMGGESTELSENTTTIVIEAANFDAMTIARTSRRQKLSSEASRRFERGVDPAAAYAAAHRAADLLVELAGGTVAAEETVRGAVPTQPTQTIDAALPGRVLGTEVPAEQVVELLTLIGVDVGVEGDRLQLVPPSWRSDLRDPYDYVEEVGRLVGYDTIEPVVPRAPVGRGLSPSQRSRRAVNAAVAAAGFVEVLTFPFQSEHELDQLGVERDDSRRQLVRLANPLSETHPYLRTTLLPGLFAAMVRNTSRSNDDLALYESGSVFYARPGAPAAPRPAVAGRPGDDELAALNAALADQPRHLAVVLAGNWLPKGWQGEAIRAGWQHAVAFAETAAQAVGLRLQRRSADVAPWHPGRCAELSLADSHQVIGFAGELHPEVCRSFGLPPRSAAAEIDLDALVAAAPGAGEVAAISSFPVAKEDVALIVDEEVPAAAVEAALRSGAGALLESVRLFDIFRGPQIGEGKKSLAFALRFRAPDRTLTDGEAAAARDAAVDAAAAATGAVQRTE